MMHHDGWHGGFGFGHWGFGLLIWIVVIIALIALLKLAIGNKND